MNLNISETMVAEIRITGNFGEFTLWLKGVEKRVISLNNSTVRDIAMSVALESKKLALRGHRGLRKRTGGYAGSFRIRSTRGGKNPSYSAYNVAHYANYLEEGTRPHFIPFGLGREEGVEHPGSIAFHIMRDAMRNVIKRKLKAKKFAEDYTKKLFGKDRGGNIFGTI